MFRCHNALKLQNRDTSSALDVVVGDTVRNLRKGIKEQFPRMDAKQLIQNRTNIGYLLDIPPEQVQIAP
jgi:hypothetical protein